MRHFGLAEFFECVAQVSRAPLNHAQFLNLVDISAVASALRSVSSVAGVAPSTRDVSRAAVQLITDLLIARPFKGRSENLLAVVCEKYVEAYGFRSGMHRSETVALIAGYSQGSLSAVQVQDAIQGVLAKDPTISVAESGLTGCKVYVVDPDVGRVKGWSSIAEEVNLVVEQLGAEVLPALTTGTTINQDGVTERPRGEVETEFAQIIRDVTSSQVMVVVNTARDDDASAKREWAFRCGVLVLEVGTHRARRTMRDGPRLARCVHITGRSRAAERRKLFDALYDIGPRAQDQKAYSWAMTVKNEELHRHLSGAWVSLDPGQQARIADGTTMSRGYISGLLSHPAALELAGASQLDQLCPRLRVPRRVQFRPQLTAAQRQLLAGAMRRAECIEPAFVLDIYSRAQDLLTDSMRYSVLRNEGDADRLVEKIVRRMEEGDL